jgi:predicted  nucleic acid-binding Zn ribbon protein
MNDPYFKLKPRGPTPADECCRCTQLSTVYLAHVLSENPIHCGECRGEVAPEKFGFDDRTTESIADWNTTFGAVYSLWLNSGAYEAWAESELRSRDSAINRDGLAVREALSRYVPTSYLWFWNGSRPISCPSCGSEDLSEQGQLLVCPQCSVSV